MISCERSEPRHSALIAALAERPRRGLDDDRIAALGDHQKVDGGHPDRELDRPHDDRLIGVGQSRADVGRLEGAHSAQCPQRRGPHVGGGVGQGRAGFGLIAEVAGDDDPAKALIQRLGAGRARR